MFQVEYDFGRIWEFLNSVVDTFVGKLKLLGFSFFLLRTMKEGRKLVGVKCKIQRCADVEGFRGMGSF